MTKLGAHATRLIHAVLALGVSVPTLRAQTADPHPFPTGAITAGPIGFARPPVTMSFAGAYAHAPVHGAARLLLGGQAGVSLSGGAGEIRYALGTAGFAQQFSARWQVVPFVGMGVASQHPTALGDGRAIAATAGYSFERLIGTRRTAPVIGARIGYITRSMNDDGSVAYAALSLGVGRARGEQPERRTHIAEGVP